MPNGFRGPLDVKLRQEGTNVGKLLIRVETDHPSARVVEVDNLAVAIDDSDKIGRRVQDRDEPLPLALAPPALKFRGDPHGKDADEVFDLPSNVDGFGRRIGQIKGILA